VEGRVLDRPARGSSSNRIHKPLILWPVPGLPKLLAESRGMPACQAALSKE
jgi:hypothetical protein